MSLIENLTKKVAQTAKSAAKKSGEIVELTKLNISIASEEEKIEKLFIEIGEMVYNQYLGNLTDEELFREQVTQIEQHKANIEEIKKKIMQVKNSRICLNCDSEINSDAVYCSKCGKRQEITSTTIVNDDE